MGKKLNCFSPKFANHAMRMLPDHRSEYPFLWAAIESIAPKVGRVPQTLHEWVRKLEVGTSLRDGITSEERDRIEVPERESKELRQANEILKLASAFLPRRSSTSDLSPEGLFVKASQYPWGRADLQGFADCPVRVFALCFLSTPTSAAQYARHDE